MMNGYGPAMGGYFMPVDRRDIARNIRQEVEGLWSWTPEAEAMTDELKRIEHFGSPRKYSSGPSYYLTVSDDGYEIPMDEYLRRGGTNVPGKGAAGAPMQVYGQQTWSPMISTSYPGMFWDPAAGKMSTQAEIMGRLKWPTMGGIPYQYNPPRRRGFGMFEYPLVEGVSGAQWGYGAEAEEWMKNLFAALVTACSQDPQCKNGTATPVYRAQMCISFMRGYQLSNSHKAEVFEYYAYQLPFATSREAQTLMLAEAARYRKLDSGGAGTGQSEAGAAMPGANVLMIAGAVGAAVLGVIGCYLLLSSKKGADE